MPITATCTQAKRINDSYGGKQRHNCEGYVVLWKVWGKIGRYLEDCECECHAAKSV
jgi:hypothetical protein